MRILILAFALMMSTTGFSDEFSFGVSSDAVQVEEVQVSNDMTNRDNSNRGRLLAAGIYSARAGGVLCNHSVRPVFSGQQFIGYDVTTLGTCQRLTARFTCRRNYCVTSVDSGLYISIVSVTSYVFTNQNEGKSSIFEL